MKEKRNRIRSSKYVLGALLIIATISLLAPTSTATMTPDYVAYTLEPGDCYSVIKNVTIPEYTPKADIVFAFDLTGSMSGIINAAKTKATSIMNTLITNYPGVNFNFGVMSYMDYPDSYNSCGYSSTYGYASAGDYAYALNQSLTSSTITVSNAINGLTIGSGGDGPQDYTRIFYESYADGSVGWRSGSRRILLNFGDNVPHDCDLNQGVTSGTWSTGKDPGRNEIVGDADDLDLQTVLNQMAANNVVLLEGHSSSSYSSYWNYWTGLTGGNMFITSSGTFETDVINAIVSGITIPVVNNLHLEVNPPAYSSWLTSVVPSSYAMVNPGDSVFFNETICVPRNQPCGVYTFTVRAVDDDGIIYGEQTNVITIPCDEIPPTTIKEHGPGTLIHDPTEDVWYMHPSNPIYLYARDDHPNATGVQLLHYEVWYDPDCDGVYDILKYAFDVFDNGPMDLNPNVGEIDVEIIIDQECCHRLDWYAVDNADNQEEPHEQHYRLDATPPEIVKEHPDHGYYQDPASGMNFLKCDTEISLFAYDLPECQSGVKDIYWGYEFNGTWYPDTPTDIFAYGNYWYTYDDMEKISFDEECIHVINYWAEDNLGNMGQVHTQTYYVDCAPPWINKIHPDDYVEIDPEPVQTGWIMAGSSILMEVYDMGTEPCIAGVENLFWRYEHDGTSYPLPGEPGAIDGATLAGLYGYTDPEILDYWWYIEFDSADIQFDELGKHDLYYWAKDNVCNRGPVHHQCYWVNVCQPEVWVDDDYTPATPGWYITHFNHIQTAIDWLEPGGTAYIYDGNYNGDILVDDVPWCDNTGITIQGGDEGCFPNTAWIYGSIIVKVDDVTVRGLGFKPSMSGSIILEDEVTGVIIKCNLFDGDCYSDAIGVYAMGDSNAQAMLNWWGRPNGPNGGIMNDAAIADGYGVIVIGEVYVEPWIGIHAEIAQPTMDLTVEQGEIVHFDATVESWAYSYGDCCEEEPLHLQYEWNFGDGTYSHTAQASHKYDTQGSYQVTLQIDSPGIPDLYFNTMFDWDYLSINVTGGGPSALDAHAGGGELQEYEVFVGDLIQFGGSASGGSPPYRFTWDFGDGETCEQQQYTKGYETEGTYTAEFTVYDSVGNLATDSINIIVNPIEEDDNDDNEDPDDGGTEEIQIIDVTGGFGLTAIVQTGATSVNWMMTVDGLVIFGDQASGGLSEETTSEIAVPLTLGFGQVEITIVVDEIQKSYSAFLLGPIFLNIQEKN